MEITSTAELRAWLAENHTQAKSVCLVTYKRHVADKYVAWEEIVDEVLCFGWIDSLPRRFDADRTMLRLSPRQRASAWSKINKERVARLTQASPARGALATTTSRSCAPSARSSWRSSQGSRWW